MPYKTNLGVIFWEGDDKKLESSGFYFHIEPKYFFLGGGTYVFTDNMIKTYREALSDKAAGGQIATAIKKVTKAGYKIGGKHLETLKGFDENFPHMNLFI
jgi:uncharacterized protein (DUF2461 family)